MSNQKILYYHYYYYYIGEDNPWLNENFGTNVLSITDIDLIDF